MREQVKKLRESMEANNIDIIIIPTADYHMSEYVHAYFKERAYVSGFTGSAGTLMITKENAYQWVDGRYFIQAEKELNGSGVDLMKMGEPNVPTLFETLEKELGEGKTLCVDGRVLSCSVGEEYQELCEKSNAFFVSNIDLVDTIWTNRPSLPKEPLFILDEKYCGEAASKKIQKLRAALEANCYIEANLDSISWLLNVRGNDIPCNPVFLSYLLLTQDKTYLYIDETKLSDEIKKYFADIHVEIKPYNQIYNDLENSDYESCQVNCSKTNYSLIHSLPTTCTIVNKKSPIELWKAMKNETEQQCLRESHLKDGIAMTKFMYWLKKNVGKIEMDELSVDEYLTHLRSTQEGFIEPSFGTIAGYKEHGAMMHYSANKDSAYKLSNEGMLLVDSGGQYYEGTTDITRTFALGKVSDEMKHDFTLVLKGMISLSKQKFLYGCGGLNVDILARSALWNEGIDYKCGTGHGVGFLLNVHEGPHGIRWRLAKGAIDHPLEEGMVVTNEPGVYKEGQYGIRIENELLVQKDICNEYGQFMKFETITYVPIDLDLVIPTLLNEQEKAFLNEYHKNVNNLLSPYMTKDEKEFLDVYTREI